MAKTNNKPETAAPSFEDIKAELDAVQAELAAARNDVEMLTTDLAKAEDDKRHCPPNLPNSKRSIRNAPPTLWRTAAM
ncbi:hypothetical protein NEIPOLOT_00443 [Neisseria polysaccharea ATCC 43768]|nr:hypothetical protein NEIPOLOT_00443 [Neisseria polysaccharea ATCC 43768]